MTQTSPYPPVVNSTPPTADERAAAAIASENASRAQSDTYTDGPTFSREDSMTEQEKNPGVVEVAVEPIARAAVMTLAPREPYPTGNPQNRSFAEINGWPVAGDVVNDGVPAGTIRDSRANA